MTEREETYRALLDGLPDVVMRFDRQFRHLFCSENVVDAVGIPAADFIGKTHQEMGFPEHLCQIWESAINDVFETGNASETEFSLEGPDGRIIHNWRLVPERDDSGNVAFVLTISRDMTAQRRAEDNYRSLFLEMLEGFALHEIICDESGSPVNYRFLAINPAFERMTGFKASEIVGKTVLDVMPGTEQYWINEYGRVALTGMAAYFENYSSELGKHFEVTAFRPAPGQFACIFTDVTERRKAQEQIALNESRLRSLVSIMQHRAVNVQDFLDYALHEAISLSGSTIGYIFHYYEERRELVLNTWSKGVMDECNLPDYMLVYPLDATGFWGEAVRQRRPMILNDYDAPNPLKKGYPPGHAPLKTFMTVPVIVNDSIVAVVGLANKPGGYNDTDVLQITLLMDSVFRDLERVRTESALRESESRYRSITEHSHNGICIVDENARIIWCNQKLAEMSGFTVEQMVSAPSFASFIAPESLEFVVPNFGRFVAGREYEHHYEFWFVNAAGEKRLAEKFMSDYRDQDGKPRLIINIRDITEERRAEQERARLEEQLQQAMKMEAVGRLAGGVAHDFNNLLTGITGHVSLALMDLELNDPLTESLKEIKKAAETAAALTRQLLAFSRKQLIEPRILDLNEIIASAHKMLVRLIGENILLTSSPGDELWAVRVDPAQIEQILVNLAVNARDAMPDGGELAVVTRNVELDADYCRLHTYVKPGPYVMLSVSDTGQGMSDDVKSHLFEPFFTTKPKGRGTGFGLATIYGAVKQAGGSIEVLSEEGRGTTVEIYLPRADGPAECIGRPADGAVPSRGSETVLLVEDEDIVREIVVRILELQGYRVLESAGPDEAIKTAREYRDRINLLMTDVVMPGMNGRQLADRLLAIHPEMRVLYSSGYSETEIAQHGIIEQGLNYIAKPFTPDTLACKLREVLD